MSKPFFKVTADFTKNFQAAIEALKTKETLVGIPEGKSSRKDDEDDEKSPITNAAILFINEFGSPINNIPPTPILSTGIKLAKDDIAEQYKKAAIDVLSKGQAALDTYFGRAGFIASSSCKRVINEQIGFDEPAESTLKSREARGFKGTKRMVVTGQTRNAITFVVSEKGLLNKKGVR